MRLDAVGSSPTNEALSILDPLNSNLKVQVSIHSLTIPLFSPEATSFFFDFQCIPATSPPSFKRISDPH